MTGHSNPRPHAWLVGTALAALGLALRVGPVAAQDVSVPRELTLETAVELARENNPSLLGKRNDVDVSRSSVRTSVGDFLPTLNANLGFGYTAPGERRAGSVVLAQQPWVYSSSYGISAGYSFSVPRLFAPRAAREELRATTARLTGEEAMLAGEVAQRYLSGLEAAEQITLADREIARSTEHLRNARDRLGAGTVLPLEVRRAEVQVGRAELRRVRAANAYAAALQGLGRSLGLRLDPGTRLVSRLEMFEPRWNAEEMVEKARRANPALHAAEASAEAAETRVKSARAGSLPTLSLGVSYQGWAQMSDEDAMVRQRLGSGASDPATVERIRREVREQNQGFPFGYNRQPLSASVGVSIPIFSGFGRVQQARQAQASAEDARFQLRAEELRVEQEVNAALLDLSSSREAAQVAARVHAAATEELAMTQERFRLGLANSLAVLDAQGRLSEAEQEQATAVFDFHRALARLEALAGQSLR
jgi:outer membrane protein